MRCSSIAAWTSAPPSSRSPSAAAFRITCSTCSTSPRRGVRRRLPARCPSRDRRDPRRGGARSSSADRALRVERAPRLPVPGRRMPRPGPPRGASSPRPRTRDCCTVACAGHRLRDGREASTRQNGRRIVRALEVIELTGEPKARRRCRQWSPECRGGRSAASCTSGPTARGLVERLDARVLRHVARRASPEDDALHPAGLERGVTSRKAIGYAQAVAQSRAS